MNVALEELFILLSYLNNKNEEIDYLHFHLVIELWLFIVLMYQT